MISGIFTAIALLAFLAVCFWAFSRHKRDDFEAASRLPLDEEDLERLERADDKKGANADEETDSQEKRS